MYIPGLLTTLRGDGRTARLAQSSSPTLPPAPPTAAGVLISTLVTVLGLGVVLAVLCILLTTGLFLSTPPKGDKAMIIVVPMAAAFLGGLACVLAGWLVLARGGLAWLGPVLGRLPGAVFIVSTLATLGVGLGMFFSVITWANRSGSWGAAVPIIGCLVGSIAPGLLAAILVVCSTRPPQIISSPLAVGVGWVGLAAVGGWALLVYALFGP